METIEVKNSITKGLASFASLLFFAIISLYLFFFPNQPTLNFIGAFGLILFNFLAIASLIYTFNRKPRLVISSEGVFDETLSTGLIDWYDIENVYLQKIGNSRFICFVLRDEEKYLPDNHQKSKKLSIFKEQFAMETVNINIESLDINEKDLLNTLKKEIASHDKPPKPVSLFDYPQN